ncbi:MAG: DNA alkylation repair protein [Verrucomicrobiota bacterium]
MTEQEVMALLAENQDERGIRNWELLGEGAGGLESFGIGLTKLRKLAKQIGRDHSLALRLWESENHDARLLGLLIDEPKALTREQIEKQVEGVGVGSLAHVFSSCDATLAKAPFVFELASDWIKNADPLRRQCGYGLVYELSKNQRKKELTDAFFLDCVDRIRNGFEAEGVPVRMSMGTALMGIGKRNKTLNQSALELATELGPIDFSEDGKRCDPFDVAKHLTSADLKAKLGI